MLYQRRISRIYNVPELAPGFVESFTEQHRDQFQVGLQALKFRSGQGSEQIVAIGVMQ